VIAWGKCAKRGKAVPGVQEFERGEELRSREKEREKKKKGKGKKEERERLLFFQLSRPP